MTSKKPVEFKVLKKNSYGHRFILEPKERVYQLLKDQKEFFRTKAPGLRDDCKRRENGFIKWYEQNFMAGKKEVSNQTSLFQ